MKRTGTDILRRGFKGEFPLSFLKEEAENYVTPLREKLDEQGERCNPWLPCVGLMQPLPHQTHELTPLRAP